MILQIIVALVGALIFGLCLWALFGLLLLPVFGKNMVSLYFCQGDGSDLEHRARAFSFLRDGREPGGRLLLVDCGLTEQGLTIAQQLRRKYLWLDYCPNETLDDYIQIVRHCL